LNELSLAQVLIQGDSRQIASGLVGAALSHGSRDNCTAVVAGYVPS
jgi:hypothetical protein